MPSSLIPLGLFLLVILGGPLLSMALAWRRARQRRTWPRRDGHVVAADGEKAYGKGTRLRLRVALEQDGVAHPHE